MNEVHVCTGGGNITRKC